MDICMIMYKQHTRQIVDALNVLGVDAYAKINQWQELFDAGELRDIFNQPIEPSEAAAEDAANGLWNDLKACLEQTWLSKLTRKEAVTIGNTIGVLPDAYIKLCNDVTIPASDVPKHWNCAHPEEKPIYRNDEHLLP